MATGVKQKAVFLAHASSRIFAGHVAKNGTPSLVGLNGAVSPAVEVRKRALDEAEALWQMAHERAANTPGDETTIDTPVLGEDEAAGEPSVDEVEEKPKRKSRW